MSQDGNRPAESRPSATDSPWLWIAIFLCGALIALALMMPKFQRRQLQLERQYEARQAAGQSIRDEDASETTQSGELIITLTPLVYLLALLVFVTTIVFWSSRIRRRFKRNAVAGSEP
jgi:ABC-type uncharacterized transport system permease subunit